jgi:hypothetical protein
LENDFPELPSRYEIYDEVYGSIEDQSEMIEAGQVEEPGREEERCSHEELITVEEDSRNVTADKQKDNADENEGKVDLTADTTFRPQMRKSINKSLSDGKVFGKTFVIFESILINISLITLEILFNFSPDSSVYFDIKHNKS